MTHPYSARIIQFATPGGSESLEFVSKPLYAPVSDHILIRQVAVGVNYIDIQHRSGRYPVAQLPSSLGIEASGIIEAVGPGVTDFEIGDRVAYLHLPIGAYTDYRIMPISRLVKVPESLSLDLIGISLNRGLTAEYLVHDSYRVQEGDTVVIHAAAGGVGQILVQWVKQKGGKVIGTVGSQTKERIARDLGCDHVLHTTDADWHAEAKEITHGLGVAAVFDGVGGPVFEQSLLCIAPNGTMVSFGTPAGAIPPFDIFRLNQLGSLRITSPSIFTFNKSTTEFRRRSNIFFEALMSGAVKLQAPSFYAFSDVKQAHDDLAQRKTVGSVGLRM
jgi:NADPH:quinone reductase